MNRNTFIKFIYEHKHSWSRMINYQKYNDYFQFMMNWSPLLNDNKFTYITRVYWIINDMHAFKLCNYCNKPIIKNVYGLNRPYGKYCSCFCAQHSPETIEKARQTSLLRYGVDHPWQNKDILAKAQKTMLERYGVSIASKLESVKQKMLDTNRKIYGCDWPIQNKNVHAIYEQTCLKRYGQNNPFKNAEIRDKSHKTCLNKYGAEEFCSTDEFKKRRKATSLKKHGVEHYTNRDKIYETMLAKYGEVFMFGSDSFKKRMCELHGVEHSMQNPEIQKKAKSIYLYENINFKSTWELAVYIYSKDMGYDVEFQPNIKFEYFVNDKKHFYLPDFKINGKLIEVKGEQFINTDGTYKNPYDEALNPIYEAKHQCMIVNNIEIISSAEIKKYLEYVSAKYGKKYLMSFKRKTT